jgi:hypothetical protein
MSGWLWFGALNLGTAFEISALINADSSRGDVTKNSATVFDFHAVTDMEISRYPAVNDYFIGYDLGIEVTCGPNHEPVSLERDRSVDFPFDLQVFLPRDFPGKLECRP